MKKKNFIYSIVAFAIVIVAYCVLFLAIPFAKSAASWVSFAFTLAAMCLGGAVMAYALRGESIKSKLYGFPVAKIALIYALAQLLVGIAVCVVAAFVNVPVWIPIVVYILLLTVGVLGFIAADSAKTAVEEIDASTAATTQNIAVLRAKIAGIGDICTDEATRKLVNGLKENVRYSDPVSAPETAAAENDLLAQADQLAGLVKGKSFAEAAELIGEIKIALAERNRLCQLSKK